MRIFYQALKKAGGVSQLQRALLLCGVDKIAVTSLFEMKAKLDKGQPLEKFRPDVLAGLFVVAEDQDSAFARDLIRNYLKEIKIRK